MTTFLRFPDEARARACMPGWHRPESGWTAPADGSAVDVLGTLYAGGTYDADGNELTPPVARPGWHLNVVGDVSVEAALYIVHPAAPIRKFAA